eukprot:478264-Amorphochlora_amoeboformis.AAC.1
MDSQARNPQTTSTQTQMTDPQAVQGTANEAKLSGSETNEAKLSGSETKAKLLSRSETKSEPQGETKMNRIIVGLREMLCRFRVSENMYVELAGV